jgi:hypothetical protein
MRIFSSVFVLLFLLISDVFSGVDKTQTGPVFTPYGLAQYRLRIRYISEKPRTGSDSAQFSYLHQIGYYVGLKAKINDQISFQVQAGNDWVNTEQITYLTSNHVGKKNSVFPFFHLAFAKWDPGFLSISAGIVPENGYGALDLLERSLALGNYGSSQGFGAGQVGWLTGSAGSITGLKIGVPISKSNVKLSVELLTTIVDDSTNARKQSWFSSAKYNHNQQLFVIDLPLSAGGLTFTPQIATVLSRKYNYTTQEGDNEIDLGFAASYKIKEIASVRANAGYATFNNKNSHTSNAADSIEFKRVGTLVGIGTTIKAGPGSISVDVNYSSDENTKTAQSSLNKFYYGDLKYAWSANKYFEITPRVRVFAQDFPDASSIKRKVETRPELIFTGKF